MDGSALKETVVVKIGGSVVPDSRAYASVAEFLVRRLHSSPEERFVVVMSAQEGLTDSLERIAREIRDVPEPRTLDLLWSTGEIRSVALLTLHLEALGVGAVGLNIHEAGIRLAPNGNSASPIRVALDLVHRALDKHSIVVVPGFFATTAEGTITSLGRGGSDLTAVLLAEALEAARCELVKDVPGYFSADPRENKNARHLPFVGYRKALAMANAGCQLVQREALEAAHRSGLPLVIRSMADEASHTVVSQECAGAC